MGCPRKGYLNDYIVFGICTHDPRTGVHDDADSAPSYRIYENEVDSPIMTGNMSKLDDDNTVGHYTESIHCTGANGFNGGNTYTVYIEATMNSDVGGTCYAFGLRNRGADMRIDVAPDLSLSIRDKDLAIHI